ncbi:hypothetical protein DPMN_174320 [Dreissena polymorpha]|uniref:Uncharacterized protein n=1 Tax=Dreissena polymorpha TaxID=45954 RepID=A0A9D4IHR8_DREPO|nr:hypothetical protein DPMN_174320 [Dreissena polymorpha]
MTLRACIKPSFPRTQLYSPRSQCILYFLLLYSPRSQFILYFLLLYSPRSQCILYFLLLYSPRSQCILYFLLTGLLGEVAVSAIGDRDADFELLDMMSPTDRTFQVQ